MQQASIVHMIAALLVISASLGHIYLGTIGVEGAYKGMRFGYVDETYAKEHHELWYQDVKSGKINATLPKGPIPQVVLGRIINDIPWAKFLCKNIPHLSVPISRHQFDTM